MKNRSSSRARSVGSARNRLDRQTAGETLENSLLLMSGLPALRARPPRGLSAPEGDSGRPPRQRRNQLARSRNPDKFPALGCLRKRQWFERRSRLPAGRRFACHGFACDAPLLAFASRIASIASAEES